MKKEVFDKAAKINEEMKQLRYARFTIPDSSPYILNLINKRRVELEKEFSEL